MSFPIKASFSGFIATEPRPSKTKSGVPRMFARAGKPRYRKEEDGSFTELDPTFHDLVAFGENPVRALSKFSKGDNFVAEGHLHRRTVVREGQTVEIEQFIMSKIGHDSARTSYSVDRSQRANRTAERGTARQMTPTGKEPAFARAIGA